MLPAEEPRTEERRILAAPPEIPGQQLSTFNLHKGLLRFLFGFLFSWAERCFSTFFEESFRIEPAEDLEHLGNESGPAGLVAGSDACSVVAVKVLVKQHVVAPVGIRLKLLGAAKHGAAARPVPKKNAGQANTYLFAHFEQ